MALALVISAVLHGAVILLYPVVMERLAPEVQVADEDVPPRFRDVPEIVFFQEIPDPPDELPALAPDELPDDPPEPEETEELLPAEPVPGVPDLPDVEEEAEELTPAERLRPRLGDARLWVPPDPALAELTPEERAELMIRGRLQDWNDSVAVAQALARAWLDWTYTDDEGRRWGVSPGTLHLGSFSIPLPFEFQAPGYRREDAARQQWIWDDIQRGAATQEVRDTWEERAREIRERRDAERADSTRIRD